MAISDRGDQGYFAMRGQNVDAAGLCGQLELSATSAATAPPARHGFHEDVRALSGRHIAVGPVINTAGCAVYTL